MRLLPMVLFTASLLQCWLECAQSSKTQKQTTRPHIIFIVADDLGFNDVGYHNPSMLTPNIDKLAHSGVILNQSYVQPLCSPSRNSFLSGYFPYKTGLQHGVIARNSPKCLPLDITLLPQKLKALGYDTHMVGKWHLGFCNWNCTPTFRGFDSFYGFYSGDEDYYAHSAQSRPGMNGLDFRDNKNPVRDQSEHYSTNIFSSKAIDVIKKHDKDEPLFLYLAFQAVHFPLQVPIEYENMYPKIQDKNRRIYCGMVTAMDEAIGNVTRALMENGLYNDSVIIFTSDNGGMPGPPAQGMGNNYPLRGGKATIWEGGTRVPAFVHSPRLKNHGVVNDGLMHAVDWYSTVLEAAGGKPDPKRDGIPLWEMIADGAPSKRTEFVYNFDDLKAVEGTDGIRMVHMKLITGNPGAYDGWFPPPELTGTSKTMEKTSPQGKFLFPAKKYLFNLTADPTEHTNLYSKFPEIAAQMEARMKELRQSMVPALNPPIDPKSNPDNFDGVWSPGWC